MSAMASPPMHYNSRNLQEPISPSVRLRYVAVYMQQISDEILGSKEVGGPAFRYSREYLRAPRTIEQRFTAVGIYLRQMSDHILQSLDGFDEAEFYGDLSDSDDAHIGLAVVQIRHEAVW